MSEKEFVTNSYSSSKERTNRNRCLELLKTSPIPEEELLYNLMLYINRQNLSRFLYMNDVYQKIINVHGVIMEFGVRWGQNLSVLSALRGMYEPYNFTRKIIGFDTFSGFPSVHEKDGNSEVNVEGAFSVTENYKEYLEELLDYHESESPLPHIKKYELVEGDATKTVSEYLERHPETIISFAFFDFDIYEPTKKCLEIIKPHLTKGSILGFDEMNCEHFPGETIAFQEVLGKNNYRIQRSPLNPMRSYLVFE